MTLLINRPLYVLAIVRIYIIHYNNLSLGTVLRTQAWEEVVFQLDNKGLRIVVAKLNTGAIKLVINIDSGDNTLGLTSRDIGGISNGATDWAISVISR